MEKIVSVPSTSPGGDSMKYCTSEPLRLKSTESRGVIPKLQQASESPGGLTKTLFAGSYPQNFVLFYLFFISTQGYFIFHCFKRKKKRDRNIDVRE